MYDHTIPIGPGTYHSERWAEILGYKLDELPPIDQFWPWLLGRIHPDDYPRLEKAYTDFLEARSPLYHVQVRMRHKSGRWLCIETLSQAVERDKNNHVTRNVGVMLDITERRRVETELRESEEKFRVLAEQSPNMIFITLIKGAHAVSNNVDPILTRIQMLPVREKLSLTGCRCN